MAIQLKQYYREHGVRTIGQMVNPPIFKLEDLSMPIATTYHYLTYTRSDLGPDDRAKFLRSRVRVPVVCVIEYGRVFGNVAPLGKSVKEFVKKLKDRSSNFRYFLPGKKIVVSLNVPIVYNYNILPHMYRYRANRLNPYYEWANSFGTMVNTINRAVSISDRNQVFSLTLPTEIPSRKNLNIHSKGISARTVNEFIDPNMYTILDLWLWLNPETRDQSILSNLDKDKLRRVTMVVTSLDKCVLLNLGILNDMVRGTSDNNGTLNPDAARKLLLAFFIKVNNSSLADIANQVLNIDTNKDPEDHGGNLNATSNITSLETTNVNAIDQNKNKPKPKRKTSQNDNTVSTDIDPDKELKDLLKEADEEVKALDELEAMASSSEEAANAKTADELMNIDPDPLSEPLALADTMAAYGAITATEKKNITETLKKQKTMKSPYRDGMSLAQALVTTDEDIQLDESEINLPDHPAIKDKSMTKSTLKSFDRTYINKVMRKHVLQTMYSFQRAGVMINDHTVEREKSVMGEYEVHTIKIKPIGGKQAVRRIRIPIVNEEGEFKMSANSYIMRKQRKDAPIRKTAYNRVALTSYYGKIFIDKAAYKKDNVGYWVASKMIAIFNSGDSKITKLVSGDVLKENWDVPLNYSIYARTIKMVTIGNRKYQFTYNERDKLIRGIKLSSIEKKGKVLVGVKGKNTPILVDDKGFYLYKDGKYIEDPGIMDQLGIDISKSPVEYSQIRLFNKPLSVGFILAYFIGLTKLLHYTKANYEIVEKNKRIEKNPDTYVIVFKDKKLVLTRKNRLATMVLAGFRQFAKDIKNYNLSLFDKQDVYVAIMAANNMPGVYVTELSNLDKLYVDPMTKKVLEKMGEPTTFRKLIYRGSEMLLDDKYYSPQNFDFMEVKGYERMVGIMYKQMADAIRSYNTRSAYSKVTVDINPYAVWQAIGADSTTSLVDDVNPVANLKQVEDLTYLGSGGRSKETMTAKNIAYHVSDLGMVSEATKDSGDVGISAYMPPNPVIVDLTGKKGKFSFEKDGPSSVLSTSALLAPGITHDNAPRANFVSVQNGHSVPVAGQTQSYVSTGYDLVLPYRASSRFISIAPEDGTVVSVSKSTIKIKYKSGKTKKYKLGSISSKVESGKSYKFNMITDLKKGDTVKKDGHICYVAEYFEPSFFDKTRLVYKSHTYLNTAMVETPETDEDSCSIRGDIVDRLTTETYSVKSFTIDFTQHIVDIVSIGQEVKGTDALFTIHDVSTDNGIELDKQSKDILRRIKGKSPKAKVEGIVDKIEVYYNGELKEMTPSLRKIAVESDKRLAKEHDGIDSGRVTNEYSIQGKPLVENKLEIKMYIAVKQGMGTGDKGVFGNQLKTTVSEIFTDDIRDINGREIEAFFGEKSTQARIIESAKIIGTSTTLLDIIAKRAVELY